jgi:hypothetical protein
LSSGVSGRHTVDFEKISSGSCAAAGIAPPHSPRITAAHKACFIEPSPP